MTSKPIERRSFLKLVGAGIGAGFVSMPLFSEAIDFSSSMNSGKFRLWKPDWVLHSDGTFDLIAGDIRLVNCRPTIDGQSIFVKNTYMGDSPKGKRIIYQLEQGFVMLDLKVNSGSVSIGAELSGMREAPACFCPLGEARIEGVSKFFRQGFGSGGRTGFFEFPQSSKMSWGKKLGEQAWSYDSFLVTAMVDEEGGTIAIGSYDQHDFVQRSTFYNRPHRSGLIDNNHEKDSFFFETGFVTEHIFLKDDFIKLPDTYIIYGSQAFGTLRQMAWNISDNVEARRDTKTSYHWYSSADRNGFFSFDSLLKQLEYLDTVDPKVPLHTILIDRGYCLPGDWLEPNDEWSKGMERAAREIYQRGYRAGIWIAPFMVHEKSKLFKRHQNWLVKDEAGNPVVEKEEADGKCYVLDHSNQDVLRYIERVFRNYRKIGFIFYKTDYMDWGFRFNSGRKEYDRSKTSVQSFCEVLDIIREEIGAGSYWLTGNSPYSPMLGYVDGMLVGSDAGTNQGFSDQINESYFCQYFNNVFWQNDPGAVRLTDVDVQQNGVEKSHALWNAILGGVVSTPDKMLSWNEEQLNFWRYLLPDDRPQTAIIPFFGQNKKCKLAVRKYRDLRSWSLLILNDSTERVQETYSVEELVEESSVWVYLWEFGQSSGLGNLDRISVTLNGYESILLYLSVSNVNPPEDLSLGDVQLKKYQKKYDREVKRDIDRNK